MWSEMKSIVGELHEGRVSTAELEEAYITAYSVMSPFAYLSWFADIVTYAGETEEEWKEKITALEAFVEEGKSNQIEELSDDFWKLFDKELENYKKTFVWDSRFAEEIPEVGMQVRRIEFLEMIIFKQIPKTMIPTVSSFDPLPIKQRVETLRRIYTILYIHYPKKDVIAQWIDDLRNIDYEIEAMDFFTCVRREGRKEFSIWMNAHKFMDQLRWDILEDEDCELTMQQLIRGVARCRGYFDKKIYWQRMVVAAVTCGEIYPPENDPASKFVVTGFQSGYRAPRTITELVYEYSNLYCEYSLNSLDGYRPRPTIGNYDRYIKNLIREVKGEENDG